MNRSLLKKLEKVVLTMFCHECVKCHQLYKQKQSLEGSMSANAWTPRLEIVIDTVDNEGLRGRRLLCLKHIFLISKIPTNQNFLPFF